MTQGRDDGEERAKPRIHYFGEVDSTFDTAAMLCGQGRLGVWDSAVARTQKSGRGQMRRRWISPLGNLYATMRLPDEAPFTAPCGAIAFGALIAKALEDIGCKTLLKWPNDLVQRKNGGCAKVGGILIEERNGCALAGIGINLKSVPAKNEMREESALPPGCLACGGCADPGPSLLWQALAKRVAATGSELGKFKSEWKRLAGEYLIWQGDEVEIKDGSASGAGKFVGIADSGAAILEQDGGKREYLSGSMARLKTDRAKVE